MHRVLALTFLVLLALGARPLPATAFIPSLQSSSHHVPPSTSALQSSSSSGDNNSNDVMDRIQSEARELYECVSLALGPLFQPDTVADDASDIVKLCDEIDDLKSVSKKEGALLAESLQLRLRALSYRRYELLAKMMRSDYDAYVATASFLGNRIARHELPNVQDVPYPDLTPPVAASSTSEGGEGVGKEGSDAEEELVPDCTMSPMTYDDSPLDALLLNIFRSLVTTNTGGITSPKSGIEGLCEQGRTYMLQPNQTSDAQHEMVRDTLGGLMTPVLPPFYRIFMSGIVPSFEIIPESIRGKELNSGKGWFYAPYLTSFVTPTFFAFLVGPSKPNRRRDGQPGGLLVEKCKFLQESGCKGLCLHQCKLPAQQFFRDELGLALTVSPNFETQECQWSFGEEPLAVQDDMSFPKGCLVGCESRRKVKEMGGKADLCSV